MKHDELLKKIYSMELRYANEKPRREALRAVVELHEPHETRVREVCLDCMTPYPCPTIRAIEEELT